MKRRIFIGVVLFAIVPATSPVPAAAQAAPHRSLVLHRQALAEHEWSKALLELHKALRTAQNLDAEQELDLLVAKADFYQQYVADLERSLRILEQAQSQRPEIDPNRKNDLDQRIETLKKIISSHRDEQSFIDRFAALAPEDQKSMVDEIQDRIERAGSSSPYTGVLTHCLGVARLEAKQFHDAHNAFHTALQITPAIFFRFPTKELQEQAFALWKQHILLTISKLLVAVLLTLIVLGLLATRPFRWVRWVHLLPLPTLVAFWAMAHRLVTALSMGLADKTAYEGGNTVVLAHPGAVLSGPLAVDLLVYGMIAVVAISFASLAISRIKLPTTRYVASICAGFCLTGAVMMCFVLNHCQTEITMGEDSRFKYMQSTFRYRMDDPLPYLLTSPKDYPGLDADGLDEKTLREYFKEMEYSGEKDDE